MNLQFMLLNNKKTEDDEKLNAFLEILAEDIKKNKIRFSEKKVILGEKMTIYILEIKLSFSYLEDLAIQNILYEN